MEGAMKWLSLQSWWLLCCTQPGQWLILATNAAHPSMWEDVGHRWQINYLTDKALGQCLIIDLRQSMCLNVSVCVCEYVYV